MKIWGVGTGRTIRPIWAAEELGLDYELVPIGPRTGETQSDSFTEMTRKQKVPFLVDGDVRLSESVAISRYLLAAHPRDGVWTPTTPNEVAKEDEWICYIYGELDETSLYVMRRHGELAAIFGGSAAIVQSAKAYAERHLNVVAHYIKGQTYVMPQGFGLADILLVSCLDWARFYGVCVPGSLLAYRDNIASRPAYRKAMQINFKALENLEELMGG